MSNKLRNILSDLERQQYATKNGQLAHRKMQAITNQNTSTKNIDFFKNIHLNKELTKFFTVDSKTEVPVAGYISGRFVSRRIDRLTIDEANKIVYILDYKTDTDKDAFHDKYVLQIKEYKKLMKDIYPKYKISAFILWLNDFTLEEIV